MRRADHYFGKCPIAVQNTCIHLIDVSELEVLQDGKIYTAFA